MGDTTSKSPDDECVDCKPGTIEIKPKAAITGQHPTDAAKSQYLHDKLDAFQRDCDDDGEPGSCHAVGEYYAHVQNDPARAAEVWAENCERRNYGNSCSFLAKLYRTGAIAGAGATAAERDARALPLYRRGCKLGTGAACTQAAQLLMQQPQARADPDAARAEALAMYRQACDGNDSPGCFFAGAHYLRTMQKLEKQQEDGSSAEAAHAARWALRFLKKGCALGHPTACHSVAVMYKQGAPGVPKDAAAFETFAETTKQLVRHYGATLPEQQQQKSGAAER